MHKLVLSFVCLAGLLTVGCNHPTAFKEVQVPGKFSLQVPAYLHASNDLFAEAKPSLQYENDSMQVYLMVVDTARENLNEKTLKQYYDSIVAQPSMQGAAIASPKPAIINGDSALVTEINTVLNSTPVLYRMEVIATSQRFYYIVIWCRKDKADMLKDDLNKVLNSFTDLNHKKV